jgi:hypothetical protein
MEIAVVNALGILCCKPSTYENIDDAEPIPQNLQANNNNARINILLLGTKTSEA